MCVCVCVYIYMIIYTWSIYRPQILYIYTIYMIIHRWGGSDLRYIDACSQHGARTSKACLRVVCERRGAA
jgi:hypothetical protein